MSTRKKTKRRVMAARPPVAEPSRAAPPAPNGAAHVPADLAAIPDRRSGVRAVADPTLQEEVKRVLLSRYTPAAFLIDDAFNILHVQGRLPPPLLREPGAPASDLLRLVHEGLTIAIRAALLTAKSEDRSVRRLVRCPLDGGEVAVGIEVLSIRVETDRRRRYLVLFKLDGAAMEGAPPNGGDAQLTFAETRGRPAKASAVPGERTSPDEDELAAVKREIQAANAELISVNQELRERNLQVSATIDDLSNLLASAEIPIIMLDMKMRIRRYTPPAEKAFGVGYSDVGRPISALKLNVDVPQLQEILRSVLSGFGPSHLEVCDQKDRWYSLWFRPYKTTENSIAGAVMSMIDITERKSGVRQLEMARDYAEAIVDTVNDSLLILNRNLKVVRASRSYYSLFSATPAEVEGRSVYELGRGQWNLPALRKNLSALASARTPFSNLELECVVPKLRTRMLAISGRVVPYESDSGINIVLVIEDVSLRKEAAEAAALRKSEARQRDFVANVSHELLTPITAIKGYAESLVSGALDIPHQRVKFTQIIEKHADRLSQLVEDLLQLSSHDAGRVRTAADTVNLRASVDRMVRSLTPVRRKRSVSIIVRVSKNLRVVMNRAELSQVIQNLCENAIKYNRKNGRVFIQARVVGRRAVVSVRDTGIGIPREDLPRIFDRFHRAENARRNTERGTGLGLSIVRSILTNRGCRVWAESDLGRGSIIFFTLPLAEKPRRRAARGRHRKAANK
ncbi:MAG: PAS domain-containing protein [Elusimicrobia bacterium]|nr:PAS domain-containing protein [Elusimicrobiota bacterium]